MNSARLKSFVQSNHGVAYGFTFQPLRAALTSVGSGCFLVRASNVQLQTAVHDKTLNNMNYHIDAQQRTSRPNDENEAGTSDMTRHDT